MDILGLGWIEINDWLLLVIAILSALYIYFTWTFGYFKAQGIPGPKPLPIIGNFLPAIRKGIHQADIEENAAYGEIYGTFIGRTPMFVVRDPDLLRHVFVKDQPNFINRSSKDNASELLDKMLTAAKGDHWKQLRSIMSPTFSTGKLKIMTKQLSECAQELVDNLAEKAGKGEELEFKEYAGAFTMDSIASSAFGIKINSQQEKDSQFVKFAKKAFVPNIVGFLVIFLPFLIPIFKKLGISSLNSDVEKFFTDVVNKALDARQESGETRTDFLQLMINSHKEKEEEKEDDKEFKELYGNVQKRSLERAEVVAQGLLFFLGGYETTATAIAFLIYNLTLHPEIQEKLCEEIVEVAGEEEIDYNMLGKMSLLDMCVHESLRMYSPAVRTIRECNQEITIKGVTFHKGTGVFIPIHAIHHDPKIWPEPEKFNPYRFSPEEKAKHGPYDWIPFGAGPRNCIAMRLALIEVQIAVAYLVREYKFVRSEKTQVPMKLKKFQMMAENGIWLKIEKR